MAPASDTQTDEGNLAAPRMGQVNYKSPKVYMLLVARKNFLSERIRQAISVGGVALSVFLIGILAHIDPFMVFKG